MGSSAPEGFALAVHAVYGDAVDPDELWLAKALDPSDVHIDRDVGQESKNSRKLGGAMLVGSAAEAAALGRATQGAVHTLRQNRPAVPRVKALRAAEGLRPKLKVLGDSKAGAAAEVGLQAANFGLGLAGAKALLAKPKQPVGKAVRTKALNPGITPRIGALRAVRRTTLAKLAPEVLGEITKMDTDQHLVFGWASLSEMNGKPVVDLQGDYVPIDEIEKSAYQYVLDCRKGGDMHERVAKGLTTNWTQPKHTADLVESVVFTPEKYRALGMDPTDKPVGWFLGFKVNDEDQWNLVKSRERTGFSVHGQGRREPVELTKAHRATTVAALTTAGGGAGLAATAYPKSIATRATARRTWRQAVTTLDAEKKLHAPPTVSRKLGLRALDEAKSAYRLRRAGHAGVAGAAAGLGALAYGEHRQGVKKVLVAKALSPAHHRDAVTGGAAVLGAGAGQGVYQQAGYSTKHYVDRHTRKGGKKVTPQQVKQQDTRLRPLKREFGMQLPSDHPLRNNVGYHRAYPTDLPYGRTIRVLGHTHEGRLGNATGTAATALGTVAGVELARREMAARRRLHKAFESDRDWVPGKRVNTPELQAVSEASRRAAPHGIDHRQRNKAQPLKDAIVRAHLAGHHEGEISAAGGRQFRAYLPGHPTVKTWDYPVKLGDVRRVLRETGHLAKSLRERVHQAAHPPAVKLTPVDSSAVRAIGYQRQTRRLAVEMHSNEGRPYAYRARPSRARAVLGDARGKSAGHTYATEVRGKLPRKQAYPGDTVRDRNGKEVPAPGFTPADRARLFARPVSKSVVSQALDTTVDVMTAGARLSGATSTQQVKPKVARPLVPTAVKNLTAPKPLGAQPVNPPPKVTTGATS